MKKIVLSLLVVAFAANLSTAQVGMQLSYGGYVNNDKSATTAESPTGNDDEVHVVQKGQTLFAIATLYKTTPEKLKALNNLSDNTIMVGQKLKVPKMRGGNTPQTTLPEGSEARVVAPKSENRDANAPVSQIYHKVKNGETIYSIADTYQISIDELMSFNGLNQESKLHTGDILIVGETKVKSREVNEEVVADNSEIRGNVPKNSSSEGSLGDLSTENGSDTTQTKSFEPIKKTHKAQERDMPGQKVVETPAEEETPKTESNPKTEVASKTVEFVSPAVILGQTIEVGNYMAVEDEAVTDTRYYGYHKNLPVGTIINLHIPNNAGFVQVKIVNRLRADRKELIGLSPACIRLIGKENTTATISY